MEFKDKIKSLRLGLNATLEDIGNAVGVSKATVLRWESGEIENIRRDKIYKLAKALHTTPSYLMGWDDEPLSDSFASSDVKTAAESNEKCLIELFRKLNPEGREKLLDYADDLVTSGKYIKSDPSDLGQKQA